MQKRLDLEWKKNVASGTSRESIKYNLGEQEIQGLKSYYDYAVEMGEVKEGVKLEFYNE